MNNKSVSCPACRAEFHPDGEDAGPGDDEWPEDTGDGRAGPVLPLPADLHAGRHRRPDSCAGVLARHQTPTHQAALQPAAPVRGGAGETEPSTFTHLYIYKTQQTSRLND